MALIPFTDFSASWPPVVWFPIARGVRVVHNVVMKARLNQTLVLREIKAGLGDQLNLTFDEWRFPGLLVRNGKHCIILFKTGNVILTGAATEAEHVAALDSMCALFSFYFRREFLVDKLAVTNMITLHNFGVPINIEALARANNETEAERAKRLGARALKGSFKLRLFTRQLMKHRRLIQTGPVAIVFAKGSIVICGTQSQEELAMFDSMVSQYLELAFVPIDVNGAIANHDDDGDRDDVSMADFTSEFAQLDINGEPQDTIRHDINNPIVDNGGDEYLDDLFANW